MTPAMEWQGEYLVLLQTQAIYFEGAPLNALPLEDRRQVERLVRAGMAVVTDGRVERRWQ